MSILERNRRAGILAIGVVFALIGPLWIGDGSGLGGIVFVLAVEAIPLLALGPRRRACRGGSASVRRRRSAR
jgi:hypothetical protein